MPEIIFEGEGLERLARDCLAASARIRAEVDRTLVEIGALLTAEAKAIAGQHSAKVAATIHMIAAPGMVIIRAGNDQTPIALLWEMGNRSSRQRGKVEGLTFRHPVFGNKEVWVEQARWPYLRPAEAADHVRIRRMMSETYDRALEPYRMKPTGSDE